jgi:hypothetical protein
MQTRALASNAHRTSTPADWRAPLPTITPAVRLIGARLAPAGLRRPPRPPVPLAIGG